MSEKSPLEIVLLGFIALLFTLLLVRVLAPFRFALLAFFGLAIIGLSIYLIVNTLKKRRLGRTIAGNLQRRIAKNSREVSRLQTEITEIERNVKELQQQLNNPQLNPTTRVETERLLRAFRTEINLRTTKIQFFQSAIRKLQHLIENHRQTKLLIKQQARLKTLRRESVQDLPQLQQLQSDLETDELHLKQIESLSLKMLKSDTLANANELQRELSTLTHKLEQ